jgi:DNA polymerase-3 subunit chi
MATAVQFYHLLTTPIERVLPKLLEKAVAGGMKTVLTTDTPERLEALNQLLWSYEAASFLPHGSKEGGYGELQPIYLSCGTERPNGATVLVVTDGKWPENAQEFERILDIFDGRDAEALAAARTRWASYKNQQFSLSYMKQNDAGGWDKKNVA